MAEQFVPTDDPTIRTAVRQHYGQLAERASATEKTPAAGEAEATSSCCAGDCCTGASGEQITLSSVAALYEDADVATLPVEVTGLSLGCGDPVTLASLQPGQTVLDLGSGGGIDCFLAAKKVGSAGRVIGVDMTPAMIERARANRAKVGAGNVEFRLGEIEHLPVETRTVDVILSNCVVNLSPDKPQVFRETFRVLKPGGRLAISDIVSDGPLPAAVKDSLSNWAGCLSGALEVSEYVAGLQAAGFVDVVVAPAYWDQALVDEAVSQMEPQVAELAREPGAEDDLRHSVFSAKITARKPATPAGPGT